MAKKQDLVKTNPKAEKSGRNPAAKTSAVTGISDAVGTFNSALNFLNYGKVMGEINEQKNKDSTINRAIVIFLAAVIIGALIAIGVMITNTYFAAFAYKNLADKTGIIEPKVDWSAIGPFATFAIVFVIPFAFISALVYEAMIFGLIRASGGKGSREKHFQTASVVALSISLSSSMLLLSPIPCINFIAIITYIFILPFYFALFVKPKVYEQVHDISYIHAVAVVLLVSAVFAAVLFYIIPAAMGFFHVPLAGQIA